MIAVDRIIVCKLLPGSSPNVNDHEGACRDVEAYCTNERVKLNGRARRTPNTIQYLCLGIIAL